jgi:hypothetical protein
MTRLQAGPSVASGGLVVIPVEQVTIVHGHGRTGHWLVAEKLPVAVCLIGPDGTRAIGLDGGDLSLSLLCPQVTGLESALHSATMPQ